MPLTSQQPAPEIAVPAARIQPIVIGRPVTSRLDPDNGRSFEDYRLTLSENASVRIDMVSPAGAASGGARTGFDTYLELRSTDGRTLSFNDDGAANSLNSRLLFTAPHAGDYIIRATAFGGTIGSDQDTSYALVVAMLPPAPPPDPLPSSPDPGSSSTVRAPLNNESPIFDLFGTSYRYVAYSLEGAARDRLQLDLRSNAQQHAIQVTDPRGAILALSQGGGAGARLVTVLPSAGRYLIRILVNSEQPVSYVLTSSREADRARAGTDALTGPGQVVKDRLTLRSNVSPKPDGSGEADFFYRLFRMRVSKDEPVTLILSSTDFEPVLEAGERETLGFVGSMLARTGPDRSARLVLHPFRTGTVFIRVRSSGLTLGSWCLQVLRGIAQVPEADSQERCQAQ